MNVRFLACLFFASAVAATAETTITVTADRVNLRTAPRGDADVVGQVSNGETLTLLGSPTDPWLRIAPPQKVDLWVHKDLVAAAAGKKTGSISVNKAQIRAGASLNYPSVGIIERNAPVEIRGTLGDWLRIAPPAGTSLFITNAFTKVGGKPAKIKPPKEPKPVVEKKPATPTPPAAPAAPAAAPEPPPKPVEPPAPAPLADVNAAKEVAPVTPVMIAPSRNEGLGDEIAPKKAPAVPASKAAGPPGSNIPARAFSGANPPSPAVTKAVPVGPAQIPSTRLRESMQQAKEGTFSGVLAPVPIIGMHPTRWRLVKFNDNKPETICYVYGNTKQLGDLSSKKLSISGAVYFFKESTTPVIFAQDILKAAAQP